MKTVARLAIACLAVLLAISISSTHAAVFSTYTSEASFLANVYPSDWPFFDATQGTDDFSGENQGSVLFGAQARDSNDSASLGPYSYSLQGTNGIIVGGPNTPRDVFMVASQANTGVLSFTLLSNGGNVVRAFGGNFFVANSGGISTTPVISGQSVTVTINGGEAQIQQTVSDASTFFGFVVADPDAFTNGIFSVEVSTTSLTTNASVGVSNVTFAVPEPSTYALLGLAVTTGGLCHIRRRKASKKAA